MKIMYVFKDAPLLDRLSVYDNYVYLENKKGNIGDAHLDFEEFNDLHRNEGFYYVANMFGVYDE